MRTKYWIIVSGLLITCNFSAAQTSEKSKIKKSVYEEVDLEDMMRRYFGKEKSNPLEGIYSVSCVITKRNKRLLSQRERIKIVERKDNYARIAILKDWPESRRDYIEVSLSYRDAKKYPIVGELSTLSDGRGFIYKHLEPDGSVISFSLLNESMELLEAEYSDMQKRKIITYRLSYLKIYPKASDMTVYKD